MTDRAMGSGRRKDYALDAFPRGEGGFGAVHRAKHKPTGQIVAFKKLREGVRHGKERFAREIAAMKSLEHPNIMPLLDDDPKGHWYVMPLADDSLWNLISVLDEPALETCFRQIAIGLAHAHAERMVHRDVKPQNILRIRDAAGTRWVVADWGLVQRPAAQSGEMLTKGAVGTEGFAAPESWQGVDLDLRADIYSLGRVIAWAMTREVPAPNIELRAPGKWRGLVAKMTATDRAARHSNLSEVIAELDGLHIAAMPNGQLIALGPDIVAEGDLRTAAGRDWTITLERLIIGDERALLRLTDSFETLPTHRRYVTLEQHGESRIIATAPRLAREGAGWAIGLTVAPRHERLHVDAIGADISFLDGFKVHRCPRSTWLMAS